MLLGVKMLLNSWAIAIIIEIRRRSKILSISICFRNHIQEMYMSIIFLAQNHRFNISIDHLMHSSAQILIHILDQSQAFQFHHSTKDFSWHVQLMGRLDCMIFRRRKLWLLLNQTLVNIWILLNGHHSDQQFLLLFLTQDLFIFMTWFNQNKKLQR